MTDKILDKAVLAQFTGTEKWYRHSLIRRVLFTDGVKYVADTAGAYWLIDEIAFGQVEKAIAAEEFQVWKLNVDLKKSHAVLTCEGGNDNILFIKEIRYTDFPIEEIRFYFVTDTILLPSEY